MMIHNSYNSFSITDVYKFFEHFPYFFLSYILDPLGTDLINFEFSICASVILYTTMMITESDGKRSHGL